MLGVLAALHRNFAAYDIYLVSNADIFVVATNGPRVPAPDWSVVRLPALAADLRRTLPLDSASLAAAKLIDREALAPLLDGWQPVNTDFDPVLDLGAERTRFMRRRANGFRQLTAGRFDPVDAMRGWRVGFGQSPRSAVELPRQQALAMGAAVRSAWALEAAPNGGDGVAVAGALRAVGDTGGVRDALYRRAAYENVLATGRAPADWPRFVTHTLDVLDDLHGGTSGVVDSAFYARLFDYLARTRAPSGAVAATHFAHGLAAWSWQEAADAADTLIAAGARGESWAPPALLHDGAVVAALKLGDAARARRVYRDTNKAADREADDLRALLIPAWIAAASGVRR